MTICDECGNWIITAFTCSYSSFSFCKKHAQIANRTCIRTKKNIISGVLSNEKYYHENRISKQKSYSLRRMFILIILTVILIIPIYSIYNDRDLIITKIEMNVEELLSGEKIILTINATAVNNNKIFNSIAPYFNSILRSTKDFTISIDEKVVANISINANLNKYTLHKIELIEKKPGTHKIKIENSTLYFVVLNQSKALIEKIDSNNLSPRLLEPVNISLKVRNLGLVVCSKTLNAYVNSELIETKAVSIDPESVEIVGFYFIQKEIGNYTFFVDGVSNNITYSIQVQTPDSNPFSDIDYYYRVAEFYVNENYDVPAQKDIEGLSNLLHQIKIPTYSANNFDCSECTSIVEWLVEGAGFNAYIVKNHGWADARARVGHAWIQVETTDGIVAVETTSLTTGMELLRPGIEARPDGTFTEYTSLYIRYKQWLIDHPPHRYEYDPNITFEEWCNEYYIPVVQPIGIPSQAGYYSEKYRFESPDFLTKGFTTSNIHFYQSIEELDWWNHPIYNEIVPFSYWNQ